MGFSPKLGQFFSQCGWGHGEVDAIDTQLLGSAMWPTGSSIMPRYSPIVWERTNMDKQSGRTNTTSDYILDSLSLQVYPMTPEGNPESTWFGWNQRIELSSMPNAGNLALSCFFIMCWTAACPGVARTALRWQRKRVSSCRGFRQIRRCESSQPVLNKVLENIKDTPNQLCYFASIHGGFNKPRVSLSLSLLKGTNLQVSRPLQDCSCVIQTQQLWLPLCQNIQHAFAPKTCKQPLDIGLGQFLLVLVLPAVQVSENCNMASSFTSICLSDSALPWHFE